MKDVSEAQIAADKALHLDDSMAAAHAALAYTEFMWRGDWPVAEREFQRAVELDDNYVPGHQWYALYLAATGRVGESVKQMQVAQQLDPLSPSVHAGLGYMSYFARDYDRAIQQGRMALQLNPNFMVGHAVLGWAYTQQKKYPEAIEELQTAVKLSGGVLVYRCALARTYALSGKRRKRGRWWSNWKPWHSLNRGFWVGTRGLIPGIRRFRSCSALAGTDGGRGRPGQLAARRSGL